MFIFVGVCVSSGTGLPSSPRPKAVCVVVCCTFLLVGEYVLLFRFLLGLVFPYQAKRLACENVSEMTYFVSSGT